MGTGSLDQAMEPGADQFVDCLLAKDTKKDSEVDFLAVLIRALTQLFCNDRTLGTMSANPVIPPALPACFPVPLGSERVPFQSFHSNRVPDRNICTHYQPT